MKNLKMNVIIELTKVLIKCIDSITDEELKNYRNKHFDRIIPENELYTQALGVIGQTKSRFEIF